MASSITVPSVQRNATSPPAIAADLVSVASAASTDITALQAGTSIALPQALPPMVAIAVTNVATRSGLAQTVDGVALNTAGMVVYLAAQSTGAQNGPWVVAAGAWTRPVGWATGATIAAGTVIRVAPGGTANWDAFGGEWMVTTGGVVDTDTITAYPRVCKGQQALTSATPSTATVSSLWVKSTTKSSVSLTEVTNQANNTLKGVLTAGAGSGSLAITGADTNTDTIAYQITNW